MSSDGVDHPTVSFDPASMLVCKRFPGADDAERAERARQEYAYLQCLSEALGGEPYLQCPRPVRLEPENGQIWMTFCPGSQLHHLLAESSGDIDVHLEHIADQITLAIEQYIDVFQEPYFDLAMWNMLYQPSIRMLSLVDFSGRRHLRQGQHPFPLETSLGCLIGSSIYHTVRIRRASWRNYSYWKRQRQLLVSVLRRLIASHNIQVAEIENASSREFDTLARRGRIRRRLWFATAGRALFGYRRKQVIDGVS